MHRRPREILSASECADEFPIAHCNLATHGYDARLAFDLPAFEGAVIDGHRLRRGGNRAAIIRIEHDEIRVAADGDRAFAREESEELRGLRAGDVDERVEVEPSALHAVR